VILTDSLKPSGILELMAAIREHQAYVAKYHLTRSGLMNGEAQLLAAIEQELELEFIPDLRRSQGFAEYEKQVANRAIDPYTAALKPHSLVQTRIERGNHIGSRASVYRCARLHAESQEDRHARGQNHVNRIWRLQASHNLIEKVYHNPVNGTRNSVISGAGPSQFTFKLGPIREGYAC